MSEASSGEVPVAGMARRADRGVVAIGGAAAETFLEGLVTASVAGLTVGAARFGALLAPQGKVLFDFFVVRIADGFLIEIAADQLAAFVKRLGFYRLRAAVTIADASDRWAVVYAWGETGAAPAGSVVFDDPRLAELGRHLLVPTPAATIAGDATTAWHARRIGLGVPESGLDFDLGEVFPHDVDMDDLAGVDFQKGCFVGQEVVSRMKHRGTARKRFVEVAAIDGDRLPGRGAEVLVEGRSIGTMGSSAGRRGLAEIRLDRTAAARAAGVPIVCDGVALDVSLPAFARFGWPAVEPERD